jgi:hypothetical protein
MDNFSGMGDWAITWLSSSRAPYEALADDIERMFNNFSKPPMVRRRQKPFTQTSHPTCAADRSCHAVPYDKAFGGFLPISMSSGA